MKICELLIWTWETEIMKQDMIWRIMKIQGSVIHRGWTTSSSGKIRILQRYLLADTLQIAVAIGHQVIVLLFLLTACFFFFFAKHEDFYTTLFQNFSIALVFFWWYHALLMSLYWISQTSLQFDQCLAEYEELAREFAPIKVGKLFWMNNNKGQ